MHLVIPVKRFDQAKGRLADVLSPEQRRRLMQAMLEDVLAAVAGVRGLGGVVLVSGEPELVLLSRRHGVRLIAEPCPGQGLNANLTAALALLAHQGVSRVLLLHADIPLAGTTDLQELVDAHLLAQAHNPLVLVPDTRNDGTNVLICNLPLALPLKYGAGSFEQHRDQALAQGMRVVVERKSTLALDIDSAADLQELVRLTQANDAPGAHRKYGCHIADSRKLQLRLSEPLELLV